MAFAVMEIAGVRFSLLRAENPALCGGAVRWIAAFASRFEEDLDGSRRDARERQVCGSQGYRPRRRPLRGAPQAIENSETVSGPRRRREHPERWCVRAEP